MRAFPLIQALWRGGRDSESITCLWSGRHGPADAFPAGMTIREWRAQRVANRRASHRPLRLLRGTSVSVRRFQRASSVVARLEDRFCPSCAARSPWLAGRKTKRWDGLRGRDEADFSCLHCDVRWTVHLEPTDPDGAFEPLADPFVGRPRRRLPRHSDVLAPPCHHPTLAAA